MTEAKTYTEMKDSGVPWIGELPAHWEVMQLRRFINSIEQGWSPTAEDRETNDGEWGVLKLSAINQGAFREKFHKTLPSELAPIPRIEVQGGDVLITRANTPLLVGDACFVRQTKPRLMMSDLIYRLKFDTRRVCGAFLVYWLLSPSGRTQIELDARGTSQSMVKISQSHIRAWISQLPPLTEQQAIASYLDRKTAAIESIIEKKQRLLALLEEKRAALINRAVTKGLNPDVPMKDSEVPWIGEIPEHWRVMKLGYLGQLQNGLNIGGDSFGSGDPFISYGDVYNNAILPSNPVGLVRSSVNDQMKYNLRVGDVLFTRTSETINDIGIASTCLQEIPKVTFAGFLIRFRPLPGNLAPGFSSFLFRNQNIQGYFARNVNLVTRASLSQDILKTLPICLPPLNEQIQIAAHLSKMTLAFEQLDRFLVRQVELLKERRQALITAAVTGKIDVRGEEA